MSKFCTCPDWQEISRHNPSVLKQDGSYGWLISWTDLTIVKGRVVRSNYAVKIKFCPFCGKQLDQGTANAG